MDPWMLDLKNLRQGGEPTVCGSFPKEKKHGKLHIYVYR